MMKECGNELRLRSVSFRQSTKMHAIVYEAYRKASSIMLIDTRLFVSCALMNIFLGSSDFKPFTAFPQGA